MNKQHIDKLIAKKKIDFAHAAKRASEASQYLSKESDRGCVLIGGAMLDEILCALLQGFFVHDCRASDFLLNNPNGGLSTFSSRIKMCEALGLITKDFFRDLDQIRAIRNMAAHFDQKRANGYIFSFDDTDITERCLSLSSVPTEMKKIFGPRLIFTTFVSMVSALLAEHARIYKILTDSMERGIALQLILKMTPSIDFEQHMRNFIKEHNQP